MKPCRPDCQCPHCDPEMAAIMKMSPLQYAGWLTLNSAKSQRALSNTEHRTASQPHVPVDIPDPYAPGLAQMRAARGLDVPDETGDAERLRAMAAFRESVLGAASTSRAAARFRATSSVHLSPPDGYQIALDKLKEQRR